MAIPFLKKKPLLFILLQGLAALGAIGLGKWIAVLFEPEEYGKYFLATSTVGLYTSVIATPTIQAFRFQFYKEEDTQSLNFFRSLFIWMSLLLLVVLSFLVLPGILAPAVSLLAFLQVFCHNQSNLNLAAINITGRTSLQSALHALSPVINMSLLLLLTFSLWKANYLSIWGALVLTECIMVLVSWKYLRGGKFTFLSLRRILKSSQMKSFWKFIQPLLALPVFAWLVNNADRFIINYFYDEEQVGLYAATYGLGSRLFLMLSGSVVAYFNASVYPAAHDKALYKTLFRDTMNRFYLFAGFGAIVVAGLYMFSDQIGWLLLSERYASVFGWIPFLSIGSLLLASVFIMEHVLYARGATGYILMHYAIGAAVNVVLSIILIPGLGPEGAGFAMIGSSLAQMGVVYFAIRSSLLKK